jgi:hypothetical protein
MAQVFISFIHEDDAVAEAVQRFLQSKLNDQAVFRSSDRWRIYAGEVWMDRIMTELQDAKVVVLILSPRSVKRAWVNFEAGAAWIEKAKIIPVCFGGLTKGNLPKPYSSLQAIDLEDDDDKYYLLRSVSHYLNPAALDPPPPPAEHYGELNEALSKHEAESRGNVKDNE